MIGAAKFNSGIKLIRKQSRPVPTSESVDAREASSPQLLERDLRLWRIGLKIVWALIFSASCETTFKTLRIASMLLELRLI
jgi:hypothetical protein